MTASVPERRSHIRFLAVAVLIALGLFDFDGVRNLSSVMDYDENPTVFWGVLAITVAPLLPLLAWCLVRLTPLRLPQGLSFFIALMAGLGGIGLTLLLAGFSGPTAPFVLVHGAALVAAAIAGLLFMAQPRFSGSAVFANGAALIAAVSLAIGVIVLVSAPLIASGRPFCLAEHGERRAISSLAGARGIHFYAKRDGYKLNSNWYLHGLLIIEEQESREVYNWSPRRMRFTRLYRAELLTANPSGECVPVGGFLRSLPLF